MENLINTVFTTFCFNCGNKGAPICLECLYSCDLVETCFCLVCDRESVSGFTHIDCSNFGVPERIFSAFSYENIVRKCIKSSKFGSKTFYSLKYLTKEGVKIASKCGFKDDCRNFIVVPIPLSLKREKSRGFNHAEIIAKELASAFNLEMNLSVLKRKKVTAFQYKKTREERYENMEGAFEAFAKVKGKNILLVDDICTSGATLISASKALYKAGASKVWCFTLAKKLD